jgi:hypothetical protein
MYRWLVIKNNITINFKLINDKWTFEICNGNHRYVAGAKDLKDAETKAFERVKSILNLVMIHTTYNPNKYSPSSNGKMPANFQEPLTEQDVI